MSVFVVRRDDTYLCRMTDDRFGAQIEFTHDKLEAMHFGSWAEAAAYASFIVHFLVENYDDALRVGSIVL